MPHQWILLENGDLALVPQCECIDLDEMDETEAESCFMTSSIDEFLHFGVAIDHDEVRAFAKRLGVACL